MAILSPRDYFIYELSSMHRAEELLVKQLSEMEQLCQNREVKKLLGKHSDTTQQQVSRLEECLRTLGVQPMTVTNYTVECMKQDMQSFLHHNPAPELIDLYCLSAAAKAEHYEIASYTGLVEDARAMGEPTIESLLEETLAEEHSAARMVEELDLKIGKQLIHSMMP